MGLAKGPTDATITRHGATVGTPQYISPEQARDPTEADIRSDLYSLGATLYHMATGSPPFRGETMAAVITKVLSERAPSAGELNPAVSDGLSLVIRKLLAKEPDLRYQTPGELLADLQRVSRAEPPEVDTRRLERAAKPWFSRPAAWGAAALVAVLAGGFGWWATTSLLELDDSPSPLARLEQFGRELAEDVDAAATFGEKLRVLRSADAAASDSQAGVVAGLALRLEQEFRSELGVFFDRYLVGDRRQDAQQWFASPDNWRDPEAYFTEVVEVEMARSFGLRTVELPADLRAYAAGRSDELRALARSWQERRDDAFRSGFEDYLVREVEPAWRDELANRDFVGAESALRDALDSYFGRAGVPRREQLPDNLRRWLLDREDAVTDVALAIIVEQEDEARAALETHVAQELKYLESKRRVLSAPRVAELFESLRRELQTHPPERAFHAEENPWSFVRSRLTQFAGLLATDALEEESELLDQAINRAYRSFVASADPRDARAWIEPLELEAAENLEHRDRHARLFAAAEEAAKTLYDSLLGQLDARTFDLRLAGGVGSAPAKLTLAHGAGSYSWTLRGEDSMQSVSPAQLDWPALVELAGDDWLRTRSLADRARMRAGIALWRLAGDDAGSLVGLNEQWRVFFARHVAGPLERAREALHEEDVSALQLLQAVRLVFDAPQRSVAAVRAARQRLAARYGDDVLAGDAVMFLRQVDTWLSVEEEKAAVAADYRGRVPTGVEVVVRSPNDVQLVYPPAAFGERALPRGWSVDGALRFERTDVDLARARVDSTLDLGTVFAGAAEVELEATVRFPELADRHRMYLFELHGVVAVLGFLRDGTVVPLLLPAGSAVREKELRRQLAKRAARVLQDPGARVYPEAEHQVRLRLTFDKRRVHAELSLDGAAVDERQMTRSSRVEAKARITPLQPLVAESLAVRGRS